MGEKNKQRKSGEFFTPAERKKSNGDGKSKPNRIKRKN
jgi:hypothetical protein